MFGPGQKALLVLAHCYSKSGRSEDSELPPRVLAQISARKKNPQPQLLSSSKEIWASGSCRLCAPVRSPKQPRLDTTRVCGGLLPPAGHGPRAAATGSVSTARALLSGARLFPPSPAYFSAVFLVPSACMYARSSRVRNGRRRSFRVQ